MIDDETRRKLRELNMGEMVDALDMHVFVSFTF